MTKHSMFFSYLLATSCINAGVLFNTLVQTPDGLKKIQELSPGDQVLSADKDFLQSPKSIITTKDKEIESYVEITMDNDVIIQVSSDQRFFIPYKWVQANQLSLGDVLLKKDATLVRIKSICVKQEPVMLRFITVEDNENFFASNNSILIHNGPFTGMCLAWVVRAAMYTPAVVAGAGAIVTTGPIGATATAAAATGYITTTEGASGAALIFGTMLTFLP